MTNLARFLIPRITISHKLFAASFEAGCQQSATADAAAESSGEDVCRGRYPECEPVQRVMAVHDAVGVIAGKVAVDTVDPDISCRTTRIMVNYF